MPQPSEDNVEGSHASLCLHVGAGVMTPRRPPTVRVLKTQRDLLLRAGNPNSPRSLPIDVKREGGKSAGSAKEMPVSDKFCMSKDFCASQSKHLILFFTLQKIHLVDFFT